jgi:hypothetical protein
MKKFFNSLWFKISALILLVSFISIQFISVERTNPKVSVNVNWDSKKTKELFYKACADCHSNETKWPTYSYIAPASWLVTNHVKHGREHFNISTDDELYADDMIKEIINGTMPLKPYTFLHWDAKLSDIEKKDLINGLKNTFGSEDEDE